MLSFDNRMDLVLIVSDFLTEVSMSLVFSLGVGTLCPWAGYTAIKTIVNISKMPIFTIEGLDFTLFLYPDTITAAKIN